MKIDSYDVRMQSEYTYLEAYQKTTQLKLAARPGGESNRGGFVGPQADDVRISSDALGLLEADNADFLSKDTRILDLKTQLIKALIKGLTGMDVDLSFLEDIADAGQAAGGSTDGESASAGSTQQSSQNGENPELAVSYDEQVVQYMKEDYSFAASGRVITKDGRQVDFTLNLNLSQEFLSTRSTHMEGVLKDPLVINFDGTQADLTDTTFQFDLDVDGLADNVPFVTGGSGFLAFDKNNDGVINDGSELFGPATGSGMMELAAYDSDANGWIDESDPIFNELSVWTKDQAGSDTLSSLKDRGVGAIYLDALDAALSIRGTDHGLKGLTKKTGMYLNESGSAGLIHEIDLVAK